MSIEDLSEKINTMVASKEIEYEDIVDFEFKILVRVIHNEPEIRSVMLSNVNTVFTGDI